VDAVDALVEEAAKKAAVAWVAVGARPARLVWCAWLGSSLVVVTASDTPALSRTAPTAPATARSTGEQTTTAPAVSATSNGATSSNTLDVRSNAADAGAADAGTGSNAADAGVGSNAAGAGSNAPDAAATTAREASVNRRGAGAAVSTSAAAGAVAAGAGAGAVSTGSGAGAAVTGVGVVADEQVIAGLIEAAAAGEVVMVSLRGDHGGRIVTFPADATRIDPADAAWAEVVPQLAGKRLNGSGSAEDLAARWAARCAVIRLTPAGSSAAMPEDAQLETPRPTSATRIPRRPFRLHKVRGATKVAKKGKSA
jgi:hypothetical protein